jgi:hypothetical protein
MKNDVLSRKGIVEAKNAEHQMYRVRDVEKGWEFWVPMTDVSMGEIDDGDI